MVMSGVPFGSNARPARRRRTPVKPPSRWKLEHPTLSIRMTVAKREEILRARAVTGRRLGDLVYDGVRGAQESYQMGHNAGYLQAVREELARSIPIAVPCRVCGHMVPGNAKDPKFQRWIGQGANGGHPGCPGGSGTAPDRKEDPPRR